ncbi:NAD(P)-dependent oxidoreductase, partial [Pseudomonas aeruginosa]
KKPGEYSGARPAWAAVAALLAGAEHHFAHRRGIGQAKHQDFRVGGIVENARPGQLLVDFSSAEPAATREMAAELEARCGVRWV